MTENGHTSCLHQANNVPVLLHADNGFKFSQDGVMIDRLAPTGKHGEHECTSGVRPSPGAATWQNRPASVWPKRVAVCALLWSGTPINREQAATLRRPFCRTTKPKPSPGLRPPSPIRWARDTAPAGWYIQMMPLLNGAFEFPRKDASLTGFLFFVFTPPAIPPGPGRLGRR